MENWDGHIKDKKPKICKLMKSKKYQIYYGNCIKHSILDNLANNEVTHIMKDWSLKNYAKYVV